jgi:hypothetical protein
MPGMCIALKLRQNSSFDIPSQRVEEFVRHHDTSVNGTNLQITNIRA